jgi:hypothetical protein
MIDAIDMSPDEARFWAKVDVQRHPDGSLDFTKCWEWKGTRTRPSVHHKSHPGYGRFRLYHIKKARRIEAETGERTLTHVRAHRHAWELFYGEKMPAGKDAAHDVCDHPPCCNPTHVRPEDHTENWRGFLGRYGSPNGKAAGASR